MSEMTYWSGVACALTVAVVEDNYTILVPLVMGILPRALDSLKQFCQDFSNHTDHGDVDNSKEEINGIKCKDLDRHKSIDDCKSRDDCECKDNHKCQDDCKCTDNLKSKDGSEYKDYNHASKLQEEYKLTDQCLDFSMWAKFEDMCKPKGEANNREEDNAKIDSECKVTEEFNECCIWAKVKVDCEDEWAKLEYEVNDGCKDDVQLKDELKIKEVVFNEEAILNTKNKYKKKCDDEFKLEDENREECNHMDKLDDKSKEECSDDNKLNDEFKVTEECNDCSNWAELKSKIDRVNLYNENKMECDDRVKLDDENKKECDDMDMLDDENKEECSNGTKLCDEYKVTEECNDCSTWVHSKEEGRYERSELDEAILYDFITNKMKCDDVVKWDDETREDCGYLVKLDDENIDESKDHTKLNDEWKVTEECNDCSTWAEPKEKPNYELSVIEGANLDKESEQDCENEFILDNENRNECNGMGKLDDENKDECNDCVKLEDACKVTEEWNDCFTWANLKKECKDEWTKVEGETKDGCIKDNVKFNDAWKVEKKCYDGAKQHNENKKKVDDEVQSDDDNRAEQSDDDITDRN